VGIGVFLDVEVLLEVGRCLWLFFGDPMSAVRDDRVFDVVGDTPDHLADSGAEGGFAAEGQDRHLKFALGKEFPVVSRVLAERQELGEARSHRAGLRVERRVVLAFGFVEPFRDDGERVPEAVEIDAFAAGDQALHVVTTEAEVPHGRLLQDLLPGSDAGQRRVDGHPTAHAFEGNMAPTARRPEG